MEIRVAKQVRRIRTQGPFSDQHGNHMHLFFLPDIITQLQDTGEFNIQGHSTSVPDNLYYWIQLQSNLATSIKE